MQEQLFTDGEVKPEKLTTCSNCEHIIAIHFNKSNLFFCKAQKGGRYGRKIAKSDPACKMFVLGADEGIRCYGGYYGEHRTPLKRLND